MSCENCQELNTCNKNAGFPKITSAFFILTNQCNLRCEYCTPKGTKILMSDFSYKNIEDIKIGDKVMGFNEFQIPYAHRKLYVTTVEQTHKHEDNLIRITLEDDTYIDITENHPILNNRANYNNGWKNAGDYKIGQVIKCFSGIDYKNIDCDDINYKIGYFIAMMLGDGCFKKYDYSDRYFTINGEKRKGQDKYFRVRLAVKDDEIIDRIEQYSEDFNIDWNKRKFLISNYDGDVYKNALFSEKEDVYDKINNLVNENLLKNNTYEYYCGFLAGIYDAEGHIDKKHGTIRICNSDKNILKTIINGLKILNIDHAIEKKKNIINQQTYTIRIINGFHKYDNLKFILSIKNAVKRKSINNFYNRLELYSKKIKDITPIGIQTVYNIGTTSRTYIANNVGVHNCFVNQNIEKMSHQTALDATNFLIENSKITGFTPSITFFGGEPLLEWETIIVPLTKYIREEYRKPFNLSITSNCVLMTEDKLKFMKKNNIGLLFSIDGDKETQDINRPFHSGKGSFDVLKDKIPMILKYFPNMTFRATIHRPTAKNTFHNMKFAIEQGYNNMFFIPNVFDEWSEGDKNILKEQVELFGDYFIDNARQGKMIHLNNLDKIFPKILEINSAYKKKLDRPLLSHKCGLGTGAGASISPDGKIYACQEMVTNDDLFEIGNIYDGENLEKRKKLSLLFNSREVHGLDDCKNCKLDKVCDGGCVANNYLWSKDLNRIPDMYCYWQQILLDEAIRICNVLGNEKNELFKNSYFKVRKKVK